MRHPPCGTTPCSRTVRPTANWSRRSASQPTCPSPISSRVTRQTTAGEMSAGEAADLLFPFLFDGLIYDRRSVFATLRKVATPDAILDTAFRTYRLQGHEGYLAEAASLLAGFGAAAWPAIRRWRSTAGLSARPFGNRLLCRGRVGRRPTGGPGRPAQQGRPQHSSPSPRRLHLLPGRIQRELLAVMARTGEPDDPSRDEARERLSEENA